MESSKIAEFYKGRSVFITGATGFLGKAIVEKLLRDCPDIEKVYIFARPSRNVPGSERVKEILSSDLFEQLRINHPGFEKKVAAVEGDLVLEGLGISAEQTEELREKVSVVLHCAATVNFNEKLAISLQVNVVSAQRLLQFAKTMKNIAAFVHVSTAYAHCDRQHIEEKVYPPLVNPHSLIDLVSSIKDETIISKLTQPLLGKRPNTYTFTKSLAEDVIRSEREDVPTAIVRPSIICGMHDGPIPGWVDNLNGPGGIYIAVGHNLVVGMPGNPEAVCDVVPVDFCSNMIIAAAWDVSTHKEKEVKVYNCTSGNKNPMAWGPHSAIVLAAIQKSPPTKPSLIRKPSFGMYKPSYFQSIIEPIFHTLPANIMDAALFLTGKKPQMKRIQRKIKNSINAYSFFTSHYWKWDDENVSSLIHSMNETDLKVFNCDAATINWPKYLVDYYEGCKNVKKATAQPVATAKFVGGNEQQQKGSTTSFFTMFALFCLFLLVAVVISNYLGLTLQDVNLNMINNSSKTAQPPICNGNLGSECV